MKNSILLSLMFALVCFPMLTKAQVQENNTKQESTIKTTYQFLTDKRGVRMSAFGTYDLEISKIGEYLAVGNGGSMALIFNRSFYLGFYGMGVIYNVNDYDVILDDRFDYNFKLKGLGHGGLMIGGVFKPSNVVHLGANLKLGAGDLLAYDDDISTLRNDFVFVATPQIEAELNVARWFKVKAGLGYRMASGLRTDRFYDSNYLNSPTGSLSFLFGWFGEKKMFNGRKLKNKLFKNKTPNMVKPTSNQITL